MKGDSINIDVFFQTYDGDVQDLNLDFTIVSEELGRTTIEELKPGGSDIPVNNDNRIEYIHLVADYKLNKQIKTQCNAFRLLFRFYYVPFHDKTNDIRT